MVCLIRWLASLSLLALLTGCPRDRIDFETDTVVATDGSITRAVRYIASGPNEDEREPLVLDDGTLEIRKTNKGELKASYELLDEGTWQSHETVTYDESGEPNVELMQIYSVVAHYAPGATVRSDHIRKGKDEGHAIRNEIELEVHDYFFVKFFDFREAHRDTTGRERLRRELRKAYPMWTAALADALATGLDGVTLARASRAVREIADPWFEKYMERISLEGIREIDFEALEQALISELLAKLPPPTPAQTQAWREVIQNAMNEPTPADDAVIDALEDVYEFCLFFCTDYGFTQTLSMPGTLESTNATSTRGDLLIWEFDEEELLFQDRVLEARSRVVYPARIAATGILLVFVFGFTALRARQPN